LKAAFGIGKRSRFGKRLFVIFFLGNGSGIKGKDVSPLNAAPHDHYCRSLPASIDLWLYKSQVKTTSRGRKKKEEEENIQREEKKRQNQGKEKTVNFMRYSRLI
jgi:hypothetical protein